MVEQSPRILIWLQMMWEHYHHLLIPSRAKYFGFQFISMVLQLGLEVFNQGEEGAKAPLLNLAGFW